MVCFFVEICSSSPFFPLLTKEVASEDFQEYQQQQQAGSGRGTGRMQRLALPHSLEFSLTKECCQPAAAIVLWQPALPRDMTQVVIRVPSSLVHMCGAVMETGNRVTKRYKNDLK